MKCPNCNNTIPISSKFCEFCGHEIKNSQEVKKIDVATNPPTKNNEGFFDKRAGRKSYLIANIIGGFMSGLLEDATKQGSTSGLEPYAGIITIIWLITFGYALLITLRRFNDLGKPKWYIFGLIIPIVNIILGFGLLFEKGKLHKSLTGEDKIVGLLKCPKCGRTYSQSKTVCSYDKTPLKPE